MSPLVDIALIIIVPVALLFFLRVNAAIVFLSLCLGSVLERFAGSDGHAFSSLLSSSRLVSGYGIALALLLLPAIFTMVVMIGTARGKMRAVLNLLPALAVGTLGLLLAVPLCSPGLRGAVQASVIWHHVQQAQVLVVSLGAIISLLFLWLQRPKRSSHDKHGRGNKQ